VTDSQKRGRKKKCGPGIVSGELEVEVYAMVNKTHVEWWGHSKVQSRYEDKRTKKRKRAEWWGSEFSLANLPGAPKTIFTWGA
jgi:hypothetical protein